MTGSISFDRAAEYYDRTRALSDSVMARVVELLESNLPAGELCLEIGIGTGRIAVPLAKRGVRVAGVDISRQMLSKLRRKVGEGWPRVAIADATHLPFAGRTFGGAIAAHVLHLIPEWKVAVDELLRVLRRGGVLLANRGATHQDDWRAEITNRFFSETARVKWPPGMSRIDELDAYMHECGISQRSLPTIREDYEESAAELLALLEAGYWSACWSMDDETRRKGAAATREWARSHLGDLDARRPTSETVIWRAYVLP